MNSILRTFANAQSACLTLLRVDVRNITLDSDSVKLTYFLALAACYAADFAYLVCNWALVLIDTRHINTVRLILDNTSFVA